MRVVTGPVTRRRSAWRGEATIASPYWARSIWGLVVRVSSCSQPLQEPASTWRIASAAAVGAGRRESGGGAGGGRGAG